MTMLPCHTFTRGDLLPHPSTSKILINLPAHSFFPTHSHSHTHMDTKWLGGPLTDGERGFRGFLLNKWHPGLVWCCQGLNWSPGVQRLLSASVSQWQQVCGAGSKLVQAWDPYLMNDSLANGPLFTSFHCRAISSFSFTAYSKTSPSFVSFIGFDWFGIQKRVGFCLILCVWTLEGRRRICRRWRFDGCLFFFGLLNWWAPWSHGTVSGMM